MATAAAVSISFKIVPPLPESDPNQFAKTLVLTVAITTVVWLVTTFLTQPEPESKLLEFYRRVRPGVKGWGHIAALAPEVPPTKDGWYNLMDWVMGCLMVYMVLFAIGKLLLGSLGRAYCSWLSLPSPATSFTGICRGEDGRLCREGSETQSRRCGRGVRGQGWSFFPPRRCVNPNHPATNRINASPNEPTPPRLRWIPSPLSKSCGS